MFTLGPVGNFISWLKGIITYLTKYSMLPFILRSGQCIIRDKILPSNTGARIQEFIHYVQGQWSPLQGRTKARPLWQISTYNFVKLDKRKTNSKARIYEL